MEDRLGLATVTRLLAVITALPLRKDRVFSLLVLRYFMRTAGGVWERTRESMGLVCVPTCVFCRSCPCSTFDEFCENNKYNGEKRKKGGRTWECWPWRADGVIGVKMYSCLRQPLKRSNRAELRLLPGLILFFWFSFRMHYFAVCKEHMGLGHMNAILAELCPSSKLEIRFLSTQKKKNFFSLCNG